MHKLASSLFSLTQQQLLQLLYGKPEQRLYLKEILRQSGMGVATIKRELDVMVDAGLLTRAVIGRRHYFQANPSCIVYNELVSITRLILATPDNNPVPGSMTNTAAIGRISRRHNIQRLSLFGSAARGALKPHSDIDLLVEFKPGKKPSLLGIARLADEFSSAFGGRKVDVATTAILNNPYRKQAIQKDLKLIYESTSRQGRRPSVRHAEGRD